MGSSVSSHSQENTEEDSLDRISELPDDIRSHILSFLPTKEAVKTCVLSHTWKNAWISIPNIDVFVSSRSRSASFIDKVLFFRDSNRIIRFRLKGLGIKNYHSRIENWIDNAVRCNVVEFDLDLLHFGRSNQVIELPKSMLSCNTLVKLKMSLGPNVICVIPNDTKDCCFPSLKCLNVLLNRPQEVFNWVEKLVCSCPKLEDLVIFGTFGSLKDSLSINLSASKLRRLKLSLSGILIRKDGLIFVTANVPNLERLELRGTIFGIKSLNAKCLKKARVELKGYHGVPTIKYSFKEEFADLIHKFFSDISNVNYLSLSARALEYVDFKGKDFHLPSFNNLSKLKLNYRSCCLCELLMKILNASPKLEHLEFHNSKIECDAGHDTKDLVPLERYRFKYHNSRAKRDASRNTNVLVPLYLVPLGHDTEVVPSCLSSCLKSICIMGFKATQGEIDLIEYMLKHGQVLDRVTLHTSDFWEDSVVKFRQRCSKLPKGSESCKISMVFTNCKTPYLIC